MIHKLKSGLWQADYLVWKFNPKKDCECWNRLRKSFPTKTEALKFEVENKSSKRGNSKRRTIGDAIEHLSGTARFTKLEPETKRKYLYRLNEFKEWCLKRRIKSTQDVTLDAAQKFASYVISTYTGKGIEERIWLVSLLFKTEFQRDFPLIARNPFDGVKKSGYGKDELPFAFTAEQVDWLRGYLETDILAIFEILYNTGIRQRELTNLIWDRVYYDRIILAKLGEWSTKSRKQRSVPLNKRAKQALEFLRHKTGGVGYVVSGLRTPSPDHVESLFERINRRLDKLNKNGHTSPVRHLTSKMLRSTFATHSLQRGAPIEAISETMGHSHVKITQRFYAGSLGMENKQRAVNVLD